MRKAAGSNSCKSPSTFAAMLAERKLTPVTLPPGWLRLATRPASREQGQGSKGEAATQHSEVVLEG
jgi:hypothetical protein